MTIFITAYEFGRMIIGDTEHHNDLKILNGKVISSWWRKASHMVDAEDVDDVLSAKPEVLVVGMGDPGNMRVSIPLRAALAGARIELIEEPTAHAITTFNRLSKSGRNVAGAFHLFC